MEGNQRKEKEGALSRREFLRNSSAVAAGILASGLPVSQFVHAQGTDRIRVGVIGIGGRGSGAVRQCVNAAPNVELWAIGDYWPGKALGALEKLQKDLGEKCKATPERCFSGFDNYKQVIDSGVDLVVMAS
ncbi:MAG: twin-arginine translocation signal domain-containing protein, partial [Armatimonadota bacterium]|nr:twin-arginine translocation signal domain-containing protein [Armatimonadota bacterium]